ncbi:MAG: C40 family peptidase [Bacteroidota bacterium]|nr:C40 family peptidase [Bacteroidota bacterium]
MAHIKQFTFLILITIFFASCSASKSTSVSRKPVVKNQKTAGPQVSAEVPQTPVNKVEKVIETARSFTGTPYRWGGTTRAGMDCSGLVSVAFQAAGISLPRTSDAQSQYGKKSSLEGLQKGDLVFFASNRANGKISHVGLVTEVNGKREVKFIHASTKLGVVENNIYSDYYRKIFVKARRPF